MIAQFQQMNEIPENIHYSGAMQFSEAIEAGMVACFLGRTPIICSNGVCYINAEKFPFVAFKPKTQMRMIIITVNSWFLPLCTL